MKTSTIKSQERKKFSGKFWSLLFCHFGKSFWIMTLWCISCTANMSAPAMLPVTGIETKTNIILSPEIVDFGILALGDTSSAQTVTIKNDASAPLLLDDISVSAGFSISASSCPQPPKTVASQGMCTVEVVFAPTLPENWVGYLRVNRVTTIQLKGSAHSGMEVLASLIAP
ncbi:MAG: choice-of-anchor D domain-containing protein [Chloroflexi bacterium]|nr:choice-of-anchor D domain-containing protein [Chloroflexota bacterium]